MADETTSPAPATAPDASAGVPTPASPTTPPASAPATGTASPAPAPAPAAGATPPATSGTPAEGGEAKAVPEIWGADWREKVAGGDEKLQKLLSRYSSPGDLVKAHTELQKKLSAGEHKKPPTADSTPEQVAEYRKSMGIPETPEGYFDKLPEGLVLGNDDKKDLGDFVKAMHEKNVPPDAMASALSVYHKAKQDTAQARYEFDRQARDTTEDALHQEWGQEYRDNINRINNLFAGHLPDTIREAFLGARLGDDNGTHLFSSPEVVKAFAQIARELNPLPRTMSSGTGMDNLASIKEQIANLEKRMGTPAWFKDTAAQKQYMELLEAQKRYS